MAEVTVQITPNNQITIPSEILEKAGIGVGSILKFELREDGIFLRPSDEVMSRFSVSRPVPTKTVESIPVTSGDDSEEFIEYVNERIQQAIKARKNGEKFYRLEELQQEFSRIQ